MGPPGAAFAAGFGAMAALLLIGGAVLLRWQRTRLQFSLMQSALERGTSPMLGTMPLWLLSLRQGVMILVLGAGLVLVGGGLRNAGANVQMPTITESRADAFRPPEPPGPPGPPDGDEMSRPPGRGGDLRRPGPRPMPESPAVEQWHRAQDQKAVGTVGLSTGFILILLGLVRIMFAFAERKYSASAGSV